MKNLNDKVLGEDVLVSVAGGANSSVSIDDLKREEFEAAWKSLNLDSKFSGMKRAELFIQWSQGDFKPDAVNFLLKC